VRIRISGVSERANINTHFDLEGGHQNVGDTLAKRALGEYLAIHRNLRVVAETQTVSGVASYVLRDGSTAENGVLVRCQYQADPHDQD
jgi:hypothetical protein